MSTIKNHQISLYCHFNKIIKGPGTNFQSLALSQIHFRNVCHTAHWYLAKFHCNSTQGSKEISVKCNLHYVAMSLMVSQILKFVDYTKTQKSTDLESKTLFFLQIKKFIN